jgi:hypothetical protein
VTARRPAGRNKYGLTYGPNTHTISRVKTTVELDQDRLKRVMRLAGIKTRRQAIAFALQEAEKALRLRRLLTAPLADAAFADAVDPTYDVVSVREREKPGAR